MAITAMSNIICHTFFDKCPNKNENKKKHIKHTRAHIHRTMQMTIGLFGATFAKAPPSMKNYLCC